LLSGTVPDAADLEAGYLCLRWDGMEIEEGEMHDDGVEDAILSVMQIFVRRSVDNVTV
jgi:hypothetical protein